MKRIIFVIASVMFASLGAAYAQSQRIGVTAGVNIANVNGISNATTKNGMIIGGFIEYDFMGGFALQPELLFSMKGTKEPSPTSSTAQYTWTSNYVEVPVLLKFDVLTVPILPVNVDLYAGPDFAFNVASKNEASSGNTSTTTDMKSSTRPFDFNIAVGGGPNLDLGLAKVRVELRYTFGTGSAFKSGGSGNPFGDAKNGVWSIMASAAF